MNFLIALVLQKNLNMESKIVVNSIPKVYDSNIKHLSLLNAFQKLENTENLPIIIMKYHGLDAKFNFKISNLCYITYL